MDEPDLNWKWVGASANGTRHISLDEKCQDRAAAFELSSENGSVFVTVVSDGAGSSSQSGIGAAITCGALCKHIKKHFRDRSTVPQITSEIVEVWVNDARAKIAKVADDAGYESREYAATLVLAVVGTSEAVFAQIGDGACVFKTNETGYEIPIWPMHGEYASTTYFITAPDKARLEVAKVEAEITDLAVFSDGIEKMALISEEDGVDAAFFGVLFAPFQTIETTGRSRDHSALLRSWLESKDICEKTDDDKTLILACREQNRNPKTSPPNTG